MDFRNSIKDEAEAYQILSNFFLFPPDEEALEAIRLDFNLDSRETIEELADDFNTLFPFPDGKLQPIESVFTASISKPYEDVMRFYADAGLVMNDDYEVVPDHISIELLFMSYLIENNKTEMEKKFLEQHLMNWVPYYCEQISKEAKTQFYREIAEIVKDFLTAEYDENENEDYGTAL